MSQSLFACFDLDAAALVQRLCEGFEKKGAFAHTRTGAAAIGAASAAPTSEESKDAVPRSISEDSSVSTAASLSEVVNTTALLQLRQAPCLPDSFARCFAAVDIVQFLGFCPAAGVVALRKTTSSIASSGDAGLLPHEAMLRLADALLAAPQRRGAGANSLHDAAEAGDVEAMWAHIIQGASPNRYDEHGCVPMHYAADGGHTAACRLLQRAGAQLEARMQGLNIRAGWTPLHFAAYAGARDVLLLLLLSGVEVNKMDTCRRTALFYAEDRELESGQRQACSRILRKFGGVADYHLVAPENLREAQRMDIVDDNTCGGARASLTAVAAAGFWDASADAADMYAGHEAGSPPPQQFPEGAEELNDRESESRPFAQYPPYVGPAGDVGPNLTQAAVEMPGFEW